MSIVLFMFTIKVIPNKQKTVEKLAMDCYKHQKLFVFGIVLCSLCPYVSFLLNDLYLLETKEVNVTQSSLPICRLGKY